VKSAAFILNLLFLSLGIFTPHQAYCEQESESRIIKQLEEARSHAAIVRSEKLESRASNREDFTPLKSTRVFDWWELPIRPFYPASEVKFTGNYYLSKSRILRLIHSYLSKDILFVETAEIKDVLEREPWVHSVRIDRGYFSGLLEIEIFEERPWLVVQLPDTSWLLSKNRKFISPLRDIEDPDFQLELSELPRFVGLVSEGEILSSVLELGLDIIEKIDAAESFQVKVDFYQYEPELGLKLTPRDFRQARAREIIFNNDNFFKIEKRLARYALVREDLKARNEIAMRVDLRFDQQVIVDKSTK